MKNQKTQSEAKSEAALVCTDLLACPHCGSKQISLRPLRDRENDSKYFKVLCHTCYCQTGREATAEDATKKWNNRWQANL